MNNQNSGNFDNQNNSQYNYPDPGYNMYPNNYGSMPPKKNNTAILIIVLISVVAFLLCLLITLTTIFILKSRPVKAPVDTPSTSSTSDKESGVPEEVDEENPVYVTCVSNAIVYVRSGPDKSNSIVLRIKGGDTSVKLKSTGNSTLGSDGYVWYEVTIPSGQKSWVRSDVVTLDGPNPYQRPATGIYTSSTNIAGGTTLVTKSYNSRIFVRSGPSKAYTVIYIIAAGDTSKKLTTTGSAAKDASGYIWYQVITPANQVAWVRSDIVTVASSTPTYYYSSGTLVTKSYSSLIYVRSGPGKNYKVVYSIAAGDTSKKLSYTGNSRRGNDGYIWYNVVTPNGINAWVRSDIVRFQ